MNPEVLDLAEFGSVLSTRERGREAADKLQDRLSSPGVVLDFAGVTIATPSFLDELVVRLGGLLRGNETKIAIVTGVNEDIADSLLLVLDKRGLRLAALTDDHIDLLGGSRQLQETLDAAQRARTFQASDLADELKIKLPNLHQRLKALMEAGAVTREPGEATTRGRRYDYSTPDPATIRQIEPEKIPG